MTEQMLELQDEEPLSLTVEVSDEALEAAGSGNGLGARAYPTVAGAWGGCTFGSY